MTIENVSDKFKQNKQNITRNVSPSCKALIPFTDLAILFGPFGL